MRNTALVLLCLLLASGFVNVGAILDRKNALHERDAAKAAEEIALAKYAEASTDVGLRVDTVKRWSTKWDTVYHDTGSRITDTAWVKEALAVADTTIRACTDLVTSCETFRFVSDSLLRVKDLRIASLQPSRWDKVKPFVYAGTAFWLGTKFQR